MLGGHTVSRGPGESHKLALQTRGFNYSGFNISGESWQKIPPLDTEGLLYI